MNSSDLRARARQMLAGKWGMAILVTFLAGVLGALLTSNSTSFNLEYDEETLQYLPENLVKYLRIYLLYAASVGGTLGMIQFVLGGVVQLGYCKYLLNLHDGEHADIKDLFSEFNRFADAFVMSLLRSIYIFLWTLLFFIPGLVAFYKYAMAPFILLENPGMKPNDAITASKELMDGHKGELFVLGLTFLGWSLLSALTFGIGNLWLNPYINASYAAFYRSLSPRAIPEPIPAEPIVQ